VRCRSTCSGDPFAGLARAGAEVPTTAAGFVKLAPARQHQLVAALGRADCATTGRQHGPYLIACDRGQHTGSRLAFLLGDPVFVADDVRSATATAPDSSLGRTEWAVQLRLTPPATNAFAEWTAAHNTGGRSPSGAVTTCAPSGTPCDDYLAIVVNGRVLSTPYTVAAIRAGAVQISGDLTAQSAKRLAAGLS
jgi:preprotein translocase subunit SecD